uniref:Uncharacterized protein n=1 Tax=Mesocestoides corti TaxID=53468 RepID=A0A5K3G870_MESCO
MLSLFSISTWEIVEPLPIFAPKGMNLFCTRRLMAKYRVILINIQKMYDIG